MNIEGTWIGFYEFGLGYFPPEFGERVRFTMNIRFEGDSFSGEITEAQSEYSINEVSSVKGFIEDGLVSFVKTYENSHQILEGESNFQVTTGKEMEVRYTGEYNEKFDCIFGIWEIETEFEEGGVELVAISQGIWKMTRDD